MIPYSPQDEAHSVTSVVYHDLTVVGWQLLPFSTLLVFLAEIQLANIL
jgi:hypothetical protein